MTSDISKKDEDFADAMSTKLRLNREKLYRTLSPEEKISQLTAEQRELIGEFSLSIINPDGSIIAEIPLFADLRVYLPYSTDLKMLWAKCWYGPIELPNQPSSDILTIKL